MNRLFQCNGLENLGQRLFREMPRMRTLTNWDKVDLWAAVTTQRKEMVRWLIMPKVPF